MAARVNKDSFEEVVLKSEKPVLVDFYSDTCIPCKMMSGMLGDIEDENEDAIKVVKVNVNYDEELAEQYKVMSVPTLLYFEAGAEVARLKGAASKDEIEDLIGV
ncbi:MAG: thioredoxin [Lachnospiraceae bacterium]|nr:thioredoxin [Lachnospiraceae bacterium]